MEALKDPVGDRPCKDHPAPPSRPLTDKLLYPEGNKKKPDIHLKREDKGGVAIVKSMRLQMTKMTDDTIRSIKLCSNDQFPSKL